jgi:tRNA(Ile)-lysidine synthase TilS/MesJ
MLCSVCRNEAVIFQPCSGRHLCREHFIHDFEARVKRIIRQHQGMRPGDRIAVCLTGDGFGEALLSILEKLTGRRRNLVVEGIPVSDTGADCIKRAGAEGYTKIALATPLEDTAASVLSGILRGAADPYHARYAGCSTLPVISPFCHIPAREIALYGRTQGVVGSSVPEREMADPFLAEVKLLLTTYAERHPGAMYAVVNLGEALATCGACAGGEGHGA